ncbi:MAG: hypothetical protein NZL98_08890 [Anaerolineales bacterium]|nr:hypothetical protein [Anaerolineales bacterium]MDW8228177.1 hypothetical protein [Anaerolineales bacterium]
MKQLIGQVEHCRQENVLSFFDGWLLSSDQLTFLQYQEQFFQVAVLQT